MDGAIRAELAHLGGGADALLDPVRAVLVRLVDEGQCLDVRVKVFREQVVVVLADRVEEPASPVRELEFE